MSEMPPTAADQRAQRNGWDSNTRAYRLSKARALRAIRVHCEKAMPGFVRPMVHYSAQLISKSWSSCLSLDALLVDRGDEPLFRKSFAIFHDALAVEAISRKAYMILRDYYEGTNPRFVEWRANRGQGKAKYLLHQLRELLRDGYEAEVALEILSKGIQDQAGNPAFLKDLADVLADHKRRPERFSRSLTQWIVRGWLTLRLYECPPDGRDAHGRVCFVSDLLQMQPPSENQFQTAWRNVRSRVFGKANPYFSQSAGAD